MSTKRSTLIIVQDPGRQYEDFQDALTQVKAESSIEIVRYSSLKDAITAVQSSFAVSVWVDRQVKGFDFGLLQQHFHRYSEVPNIKKPSWYLLHGETDEIAAYSLAGSVKVIAHPGIAAFKEAILSDVEVLKKPLPAGQFSYSWSGKAALGEKEANNRIFGEERFRRLVHNNHDLICVIEEDGFIKYVSDSSERILGYNSESLSGRTLQEIFPEFGNKRLHDFFRKTAGSGAITNLETRSATGSKVSLELVCSDMRTDPVIRGFVINARDVTRKREAEEKIKFQARVLSNIREAVIGIDNKNQIVYINPAAEKLYKASHATTKGKPLGYLFSWEFSSPEEQASFSDFLKEHGVWMGEAIQITSTGRRIHAEISITNHANQEQPGSVIVVRDIKDRKVVENVLHESESRFRSLVEVTSDLVWQVDPFNNLTFISPKVADLLGYTQIELLGKPFEMLFWHSDMPSDDSGYTSFQRILQSEEPFNFLNFTFTDKEGHEKIFELSGLPIFKAGQVFHGYQGVVRDVTQRVHAENSIRESLAEKEILIKEIHHRVKNNMQIVSSLLFLQSQFIKDPEMLAKLQESQDRIKSMALVHEKLYQSTDLNRINFRDYIESLTRHIANSYRNVNVDLRLEMDDPHMLMTIDTAIPCGLILNELVSNAFKHAFGPGGRGVLNIGFAYFGKEAKLIVSDNGVGIPSTDLSTYENSSLGVQLVLALAKQLRGRIEVHNSNGSEFELTFPI